MSQIRVKINENEITIDNATEKQVDTLIDAFVFKSNEIRFTEHDYPSMLFLDDDFECEPVPKELDEETDEDEISEFHPSKGEELPAEKSSYAYRDSEGGINTLAEKFRHAYQTKNESPAQVAVYEETDRIPVSPNLNKGYVENQNYHETGVKYRTVKGIENVPTYRCRWQCPDPSCGDKGNHYIPEGTAVVYCYTCNTKLEVKEATDIGFPNRDDWGNFYVAYDEKN